MIENMKVGTITFWWCFENYGQILQVFAFQYFLRKRGHEPFLIRFMAGKHFARPGLFALVKRLLFHPMQFMGMIRRRLDGTARREAIRRAKILPLRDFEGFRQQYLTMTQGVYRSYDELARSTEITADVYTVGSDIVWKNFPFSDDGRAMFLDFGPTTVRRRIAYSASFGADVVSDSFKQFVTPLISRMDAIGVRESSGVKICSSLGRHDAEHVLDPVLLLDREDYRKAFSLRSGRKDLVFGYYLSSQNPFPIDELCQLKDVDISKIKVATVYRDMDLPQSVLTNPTIPEWVENIATAKLFVTNSFHGLATAILLHTPFVVLLKHQGMGMDSRLLSVLKAFGLESRIFDRTIPLHEIVAHDIDWQAVDEKMGRMRAASISFLERAGL